MNGGVGKWEGNGNWAKEIRLKKQTLSCLPVDFYLEFSVLFS